MPKKTRKHRQYDNDYPSVTQILGVLRKIALERWFQYNDGKWCNKQSAIGRKVGTQIHDAIEQYITIGEAKVESEYKDEVMNALNSFINFRKDYPDVELRLSEVPLTSERHGYNGTIDSPNPPLLIDWKSGNCKDNDLPSIYDEHKYQVSAYVYLWEEINPNQPIEEAWIVCFAKDKVAYNVYIMTRQEIDDCFNKVFFPALTIYNYQKQGGF